MLRTPRNRSTYLAVIAALFAIQLIGHLFHNSAIASSMGGAPVPFIGSPLFISGLQAQSFFLAILSVLLAPSLFKYSGNNSLLTWQKARPYWSAIWSIFMITLATYSLYDAVRIYVIEGFSIGNILGSTALAILFLLARAEVVSSPNISFKSPASRAGTGRLRRPAP